MYMPVFVNIKHIAHLYWPAGGAKYEKQMMHLI